MDDFETFKKTQKKTNEMKPKEFEVCHQIIDELLKWPISQLFYHYENDSLIPDNPQPLSFEIIRDNLNRGIYSTPALFIFHMRALFAYAICYSAPGTIRSAAAHSLSNEFEKLMKFLSPSLSAQTLDLQKIEYDIHQFLINNHVSIPKEEYQGEMPASEFFKSDFASLTPEELTNQIQLFQSPNIILRIISFIYILQPEAINFGDDDIEIKFGLISPATMQQLQDFIPKVALEAANGTIDPFFRPPCSQIKLTSNIISVKKEEHFVHN